MGWLTKIFWLLLGLVILNILTQGYVFEQMEGINPALKNDVVCMAGVWIAFPLWQGLPIVPTTDDIMLAFLIGVGILMLINLKRNVTWKIALLVLLIVWLIIKWGCYFIVLSLGCLDTLETISEVAEPISLVMLVMAPIIIAMLILKLVNHINNRRR